MNPSELARFASQEASETPPSLSFLPSPERGAGQPQQRSDSTPVVSSPVSQPTASSPDSMPILGRVNPAIIVDNTAPPYPPSRPDTNTTSRQPDREEKKWLDWTQLRASKGWTAVSKFAIEATKRVKKPPLGELENGMPDDTNGTQQTLADIEPTDIDTQSTPGYSSQQEVEPHDASPMPTEAGQEKRGYSEADSDEARYILRLNADLKRDKKDYDNAQNAKDQYTQGAKRTYLHTYADMMDIILHPTSAAKSLLGGQLVGLQDKYFETILSDTNISSHTRLNEAHDEYLNAKNNLVRRSKRAKFNKMARKEIRKMEGLLPSEKSSGMKAVEKEIIRALTKRAEECLGEREIEVVNKRLEIVAKIDEQVRAFDVNNTQSVWDELMATYPKFREDFEGAQEKGDILILRTYGFNIDSETRNHFVEGTIVPKIIYGNLIFNRKRSYLQKMGTTVSSDKFDEDYSAAYKRWEEGQRESGPYSDETPDQQVQAASGNSSRINSTNMSISAPAFDADGDGASGGKQSSSHGPKIVPVVSGEGANSSPGGNPRGETNSLEQSTFNGETIAEAREVMRLVEARRAAEQEYRRLRNEQAMGKYLRADMSVLDLILDDRPTIAERLLSKEEIDGFRDEYFEQLPKDREFINAYNDYDRLLKSNAWGRKLQKADERYNTLLNDIFREIAHTLPEGRDEGIQVVEEKIRDTLEQRAIDILGNSGASQGTRVDRDEGDGHKFYEPSDNAPEWMRKFVEEDSGTSNAQPEPGGGIEAEDTVGDVPNDTSPRFTADLANVTQATAAYSFRPTVLDRQEYDAGAGDDEDWRYYNRSRNWGDKENHGTFLQRPESDPRPISEVKRVVINDDLDGIYDFRSGVRGAHTAIYPFNGDSMNRRALREFRRAVEGDARAENEFREVFATIRHIGANYMGFNSARNMSREQQERLDTLATLLIYKESSGRNEKETKWTVNMISTDVENILRELIKSSIEPGAKGQGKLRWMAKLSAVFGDEAVKIALNSWKRELYRRQYVVKDGKLERIYPKNSGRKNN